MIGLTDITSRGEIRRFRIMTTNFENGAHLRNFFVKNVLGSTRLPRERTLHPQIYISHTDYVDYTDTPTKTIIHSYCSRVHVFSFRVFLFFRFVKMFRDIPNRAYMSTSPRKAFFFNDIFAFFVTINYYYSLTKKKKKLFFSNTRKRVIISRTYFWMNIILVPKFLHHVSSKKFAKKLFEYILLSYT